MKQPCTYDGKRINQEQFYSEAAKMDIPIAAAKFYFACVTRMITELRENKIATNKTFNSFLTSDKRKGGSRYYGYSKILKAHGLIEFNQYNHLTFVVKPEWLYDVNTKVDAEVRIQNNTETQDDDYSFIERMKNLEYSFAEKLTEDHLKKTYDFILNHFLDNVNIKSEMHRDLYKEMFICFKDALLKNTNCNPDREIISNMFNEQFNNNKGAIQ